MCFFLLHDLVITWEAQVVNPNACRDMLKHKYLLLCIFYNSPLWTSVLESLLTLGLYFNFGNVYLAQGHFCILFWNNQNSPLLFSAQHCQPSSDFHLLVTVELILKQDWGKWCLHYNDSLHFLPLQVCWTGSICTFLLIRNPAILQRP